MSVEHYRKLLVDETDYLTDRITKFNKILDGLTGGDALDSNNGPAASSELMDSVIGQIRLAIGQSNLFINERFKQFSGLVDDCVLKRGEKEVKVEDLAGFWDMIYYQVEDLKTKYLQLEAMERNNWAPLEPAAPAAGDATGDAAVAPASATVTNGHAAVHKPKNVKRVINKKPGPVRSNFREFLKNKTKEVSSA